MSTGKYAALSAARTAMQSLDTITHNMANLRTSGYKRGRVVFAAVLSEAQSCRQGKGLNFAKGQEGFSDFSQGVITTTGQPFDMAIAGSGYFKVGDDLGNVFYTRQGNFSPNSEGNLVAAGGFKLLNEGNAPIVIDGPVKIIGEDGSIQMESGATQKIPLYEVNDSALLERSGGSYFTLREGAAEEPAATARVLQGSIEESNVSILQEMARMVEIQRVFENSQKAMLNYSTISEKTNELGILA